ncbi:MAG: hypothetical protein ACHQ5A_13490, partial [Opitutales bacterium]
MTNPFTEEALPRQETGNAAAVPDAGALPAAREGGALFVPGQRWRNFTIGQPLEHGPEGAFHGIDAGSMEAVVLHRRPVTAATEWRRQAWELLRHLGSDRVAACLDAQEEDGRRIEVFAVPAGRTLPEWLSRTTLTDAVLESLARQLAIILGALHAEGLVHLNVRPEMIWVEGNVKEFVVALGGLQAVTIFDQPGLIPVEVNPFLAPPEAAGLFQMPPGPGLCAWDWWSLGRVLQECVLGRHVYGQILKCEVSRATPEQRARAELLLRERDAAGLRAGAVEAMPPGTSPLALSLVRGLLANCRDGRWQQEEVLRCLQHEVVPDRYDLPREARLFIWRKRAATLPEAAEMFCDPGLWPEGEANVFAGPEDRTALVNFLAGTTAHQAESAQVRKLLELQGMPAWGNAAEGDRRTAITALVWLVLGGEKGPGLHLRGRRADAAGLQKFLAEEIPAETVPLIQAVTEPVYIQHVEAAGGLSAANVLRRLAGTGGEAIRQAIQHGWADATDAGMQARLYALALESDQALADRLERLRTGYAGNRNPALTTLMTAAKPEPWSLVLLGFMGGFPLDYGFITHAEWNLQRHQVLSQQAARLSAAVFWRRLHRVMLASPALLGTWPMYLLSWGIPLLLAVLAEAWSAVVLIVLCGAVWRWAGRWFVQEDIHRHAPGVPGWLWRDRPRRCLEEAGKLLAGLADISPGALLQEWKTVAAEAAALP